MPRSTAHSTGLVLLASPKGHCSATTAVVSPRSSAWAAKPWAVRVSATTCMAARTVRWPSLGRHARRQGAAVLLADVRRHLLGLLWAEPPHRLAEQAHEQIVAALHEAERQLLFHAEVPLGGPAGAGGVAAGLDPEVAAVDQALEVVARHVGVEREGGGDLRRRRSGRRADVEEDVAPGRIAEGGRDGGDGGAEPAVVRAGRALGLAVAGAVIGAVLTLGSLPGDQPFSWGDAGRAPPVRGAPDPDPPETRSAWQQTNHSSRPRCDAVRDPELGLTLGDLGLVRSRAPAPAPGADRGGAAGRGLAGHRRAGRGDPAGRALGVPASRRSSSNSS